MPRHTRLVSVLAVVVLAAAARADHWAWTPPARPAVPGTAANPIDAFVRARLVAAGLTPAPPASPEQLLRRVTFDLTGLPPTPDEIDAFVHDPSPGAWAKVIDRLLASPHYGERWGRHWLDLARYADTNGYEFDEPRPDAWRYRDYVIRSFNADKPYDRFVTEQLAGDLLGKDEGGGMKDERKPGSGQGSSFILPPSSLDPVVATGFNLLGPDMTDSSDQAQRRLNTLTDMTDTAGLAFLGLTVACARCHDHKFEPIPITDYYRLMAFFAPSGFRRDVPVSTPEERAAHTAATAEYDALTRALRAEADALDGPPRRRLYESQLSKLPAEAQAAHRTPPDRRTGGQQELVAETEKKVAVTAAEVEKAMSADDRKKLAAVRVQLKAFDAKRPAPLPVAMGLTDRPGPPPPTHVLERGELGNAAAEVQPGFPSVLTGGKPTPIDSSTGRRLALAKWVTDPRNPLTARVIVNRLWQHHFGRGLVSTPSDFGVRGERPTHPELLDYLATELVEGGWRLKRMHKLMLTSDTYRQAVAASSAKDPDNLLFSRMNRLRLEGESVRDALLAVGGRLNPKAGGPGVVQPGAERAAGGSKALTVTADPREHARRSVYLFARRNVRHPFLEAFDLPDSNLSCPRRERSTTAPQALALLNSGDATAAAAALAERLTEDAATDADRVVLAYRLTLGRSPSQTETARAATFLRSSPLPELCRALFNLNEFVYLD